MLFDLFQMGNPVVAMLVFGVVFIVLVLCISVHEFAHSFAATYLGDPTSKAMGRLTLNPMAHLDPLGTLLLVVAGFGWGKPVPFDPSFFANPRRDSALVSLAGPASNFLFAIFFGLLHKFFDFGLFEQILYLLVYMNLILCFFNLIPVNPLDGFKVVWGLLPPSLANQWMQLSQYGFYILLLLIFTRVTSILVSVPVQYFLGVLL